MDRDDVIALKRASFAASANAGAIAAQFAHIQLGNPVASGKTLVVRGVGVTTFATQVSVGDSALFASGSATGANLYLNGAASVALLRPINNAASQLTNNIVNFVAAGFLIFPTPVVIPEGRALAMLNGVVNANLTGSFWWQEFPA